MGGHEEEEEEDDEGSEDEEEEEEDADKVDKEKESQVAVKGMAVEVGKKEDQLDDANSLEDEEYRLRVMMIKNKHRGLYKSMMKGQKRRENEAKIMEKKRKVHDDAERAKKKAKQVATL